MKIPEILQPSWGSASEDLAFRLQKSPFFGNQPIHPAISLKVAQYFIRLIVTVPLFCATATIDLALVSFKLIRLPFIFVRDYRMARNHVEQLRCVSINTRKVFTHCLTDLLASLTLPLVCLVSALSGQVTPANRMGMAFVGVLTDPILWFPPDRLWLGVNMTSLKDAVDFNKYDLFLKILNKIDFPRASISADGGMHENTFKVLFKAIQKWPHNPFYLRLLLQKEFPMPSARQMGRMLQKALIYEKFHEDSPESDMLEILKDRFQLDFVNPITFQAEQWDEEGDPVIDQSESRLVSLTDYAIISGYGHTVPYLVSTGAGDVDLREWRIFQDVLGALYSHPVGDLTRLKVVSLTYKIGEDLEVTHRSNRNRYFQLCSQFKCLPVALGLNPFTLVVMRGGGAGGFGPATSIGTLKDQYYTLQISDKIELLKAKNLKQREEIDKVLQFALSVFAPGLRMMLIDYCLKNYSHADADFPENYRVPSQVLTDPTETVEL